MALFATEDEDMQEAIHHVEHIIELVAGEHLAQMQYVLSELESGNIHDAGHEIEEMLAGVLEDGLSGVTLHLTLALSSARIDDAEATAHHMDHFVELTDPTNLDAGKEILALAQAGKLTEVEHELIDLLEVMGVHVEDDHDSTDMDMDTDAEHTPLQEALEAIENGDVDAATTELGHFIESTTGAELIEAQEALKLLQAGDLHGAEDAIGEMLGISHN